MHAPAVHVDALELGGDARLEDAVLHVLRDAGAVVDHDEGPQVSLARGGHVDVPGAGVPCVAEHFDDDVLDAANVVLGLSPLGLGHTKANVPLAEVLLDAKGTLASHGGDEAKEVVAAVSHGNGSYFAIPRARDSRMTTTRTWPGYSISSSICLAMSWARTVASASEIFSGSTMTCSSRPACIA